jgi:5-(carboxyamino)imidazole ribonucleotide synthase
MRLERRLSPGATIGILGGGQLGRMLALAAARLALKTHVFAHDSREPACEVAAATTIADWSDRPALEHFAGAVDVVTYEFENVPMETARFLCERVPVLPGPLALETTQDRLAEKSFLRNLGIATAPFEAVDSFGDLTRALERLGCPAILKTRRLGYDGKGQAMLRAPWDAAAAFDAMRGSPAILEGFVPFLREVSVIGTRALDGTFDSFDLCENVHERHILATTRVPASVRPETARLARDIAGRIAEALDYVGTIAVEMFVVEQDGREAVVVNEIAPRVHNSGHWTLDGAVTSQFEQHIRAVADWPLGSMRRHGRIEMRNLIGHDVDDWLALAARPDACLHLYGKSETREGRKMGHITTVYRES